MLANGRQRLEFPIMLANGRPRLEFPIMLANGRQRLEFPIMLANGRQRLEFPIMLANGTFNPFYVLNPNFTFIPCRISHILTFMNMCMCNPSSYHIKI